MHLECAIESRGSKERSFGDFAMADCEWMSLETAQVFDQKQRNGGLGEREWILVKAGLAAHQLFLSLTEI